MVRRAGAALFAILALALLPASASASIPTLTTNAAEEVGVTTAKLSGTVNPEGSSGAPNNTTWYLQYSPKGQESWANANAATIQGAAAEEAKPVAVEAIFGFGGELHPGSEYEFRLYAESGEGPAETPKPYPTFTTEAATAPALHVNVPSGASYQRVHLSATVNPEGGNVNPIGGPLAIDWSLQYEKSSEPGSWQAAAGGEITGAEAESSSPIEVEADPTGLSPEAEYQTRLVVHYASATLEAIAAEEPTFITLPVAAPTVSLAPVTTFTATTAQLKGHVDPNSPQPTASASAAEKEAFASSWHFECSPECPGLEGSVEADDASHEVSAEATGLTPGVSYEVHLIATNAGGVSSAGPQSFTTRPVAPQIDSTFAADVTGEEAVFSARINPGGASTTYRFQFTTEAQFNGSGFTGAEEVEGSAPIGPAYEVDLTRTQVEGLKPEVPYVFRVIAENSVEEVTGPLTRFTTQEAAGLPLHECPNERLREESNLDPETERPYSTELPDCRAWEQVTPPYKALSLQVIEGFSPDGSRVAGNAFGSFDGGGSSTSAGNKNLYSFSRTDSGWRTTAGTTANPAYVPTTLVSSQISPDGDSLIGLRPRDGFTHEGDLFLHGASGEITEIGPVIPPTGFGDVVDNLIISSVYSDYVVGESADLSHVLLRLEGNPAEGNDRWPGDSTTGNSNSLYEYVGTGNAEPELVGVKNDGRAPWVSNPEHLNEGAQLISNCGIGIGGGDSSGQSTSINSYNAVSTDGETVFFHASPCSGGPAANEIYARLRREVTVPISEPPLQLECHEGSGCKEDATEISDFRDAAFDGASADGSKAFFLSTQRLVDSATQDPDPEDQAAGRFGNETCTGTTGPNGCNLYLYDFAKPIDERITDVSSGDTSGEGPRTQGVAAVSEDGSHVYFVAKGVLTGSEENEYHASAQSGAENLYAYDTETGHLSFIAVLSGGDEEEWSGGRIPMQTTPDGRYLLFTSYAEPTPDASGGASQLYRYDSNSGRLLRLSIGEDGLSDDGNSAGSVEVRETYISEQRANNDYNPSISEAGTAVFSSEGVLAPGAVEGNGNLYEYEGGHVHLLVSYPNNTSVVGIDESGRDIFINTPAALVSSDLDGNRDLYDARVEGGFPAVAKQRTCASADGCHEGSAPSPEQPGPITPNFSGPEEGPGHAQKAPKHHHKKRHHIRRHHHHSKHGRQPAAGRGGHQ